MVGLIASIARSWAMILLLVAGAQAQEPAAPAAPAEPQRAAPSAPAPEPDDLDAQFAPAAGPPAAPAPEPEDLDARVELPLTGDDGDASSEPADLDARIELPLPEDPSDTPIEAGLRFQSIRTDSPRATIESFLRLRADLEATLTDYRADKTADKRRQLDTMIDQFLALIDLSAVPSAARREVGISTMTNLLDIFARLELPPLEAIPDAEAFADIQDGAYWSIPDTPLRLVRIEGGPRQGEFVFSETTVVAAPRFYRSIAHVPLIDPTHLRSWTRTWPQLTGPLIPASFVKAMPRELQQTWYDTPLWKVLFVVLTVLAAGALLWSFNRRLRQGSWSHSSRILVRLLSPVSVIVTLLVLDVFFSAQLNLTGEFSNAVRLVSTGLLSLSLAWLFWSAAVGFFDWLILSPRIKPESLNAGLLRLAARVIGAIGFVIILAAGGSALGLPVVSVIAGLGIGGLAVALAIRPTLENLIGGVILLIDKPVKVGDVCTFAGYTGTVETIGIRSTKLRTMARTLISVPNAKFADMEITNYAKADMMLIGETIGLRYETSPDQLRYVLVKMREMFHAHPRIDSDTVRVRLAKFAASSQDIDVRVYALTREWNDFFAIREDVLLRIYGIIEDAGTGFAFPSQTVYLGRDGGLDDKRSQAAAKEVAAWRRRGALPFPRLSAARIEALKSSLDYPPRGSVNAAAAAPGASEPLSDPDAEEEATSPAETPERDKRVEELNRS